MPRARTGIAELGRLLDAVPQPIYVLDDEHRIVFCNRACLEWTGAEAEQLYGVECRYHSNPDATGAVAVAAGLCPPPAALQGREPECTVGCVQPDGHLSRRKARFVPIGDAEEPSGLIVLVGGQDLREPPAEPSGPQAGEDEAARLHERVRAFRCQAAARHRMDRLVGDSLAIRRVRAQVELAAAGRSSVLVVGPPGSGRQHLAGTIHYGRRSEAAGPLVPLACAVLDAELLHSTLAAIGAQGIPSESARGALLLNDADQLPAEAQADVARVLGSRNFPMRVLATARRRLLDLARRGEYHEELACLLSTLVIELPPLKDRPGDLPMLLQLFLEEANARGVKQIGGFSTEALDALAGYHWPGNLDELIELVNQAHAKCESVQIGLRDLPDKVHYAAGAAAHPRRVEETIVLDEFLARIERELLCRALARAKGNKTKAANLLGMTRPRFYRRLVQLGLEGPEEGMSKDEGRMSKE